MVNSVLRALLFILPVFSLFAGISLAEVTCDLELLGDTYETGDELIAILNITLPDLEASANAVVSYSISPTEAGSTPILSETLTLAVLGERTLVIQEPLDGTYTDGDYVLSVELNILNETLEESEPFVVESGGDNNKLLGMLAMILVVLTSVVYLGHYR